MDESPKESLVCRCYRVPETVIREAAQKHNLKQVEEVTAVTRAGGGCSSCWDDVQTILAKIWGTPLPRNEPDASGLSSAQKRARIVEVLDREVRAVFEMNGIQIQLSEVSGDRVLARFYGDAVDTPTPSFMSLKRYLVQKMTAACGQKMQLIELNVLDHLTGPLRP